MDRIAGASCAAEGGSFPALHCRDRTSHQSPPSCWTTLGKASAKLRGGREMVPRRAGVLTALGLLVARSACDIVRTHKVPLDALDEASTGTLVGGEMAESIAPLLKWLDSEGELRFARRVGRGYIGRSNQVTVPLDGAVERENCSYFYDDGPAAIVNLRVLGELMN